MENQVPLATQPTPSNVVQDVKPRRKIWKIIVIVLIITVVLFSLFVWWSSTLPDTQSTNSIINNKNISMTENNKEITWKEFFPELEGNINEYKVTLPVNYVQHKGASFQSPKKTAYLWGTPEDVEMVKADPEITDFVFETFDIAKQGIFIARFIQSSNYQVTNGQITDNNGRPLDEKTYTWEEAKNIKIQKGALYGIPDSFAFAITGRIPGDPVNFRQLFIHNPGDASILLIELTGGPDSVNDEIWNTLVASLNLK